MVEKLHMSYTNTATDFMVLLSRKKDLVVEISTCDPDGVIVCAKKS
jgi:hypothetical protein